MKIENGVLLSVEDSEIVNGILSIPDGVTKIGAYAFKGCSSIEFITHPYGIKQIGLSSFFGCYDIKKILVNTKDKPDFDKIKKLFPPIFHSRVVPIYNGISKSDFLLYQREFDELQQETGKKIIQALCDKNSALKEYVDNKTITVFCKSGKKLNIFFSDLNKYVNHTTLVVNPFASLFEIHRGRVFHTYKINAILKTLQREIERTIIGSSNDPAAIKRNPFIQFALNRFFSHHQSAPNKYTRYNYVKHDAGWSLTKLSLDSFCNPYYDVKPNLSQKELQFVFRACAGKKIRYGNCGIISATATVSLWQSEYQKVHQSIHTIEAIILDNFDHVLVVINRVSGDIKKPSTWKTANGSPCPVFDFWPVADLDKRIYNSRVFNQNMHALMNKLGKPSDLSAEVPASVLFKKNTNSTVPTKFIDSVDFVPQGVDVQKLVEQQQLVRTKFKDNVLKTLKLHHKNSVIERLTALIQEHFTDRKLIPKIGQIIFSPTEVQPLFKYLKQELISIGCHEDFSAEIEKNRIKLRKRMKNHLTKDFHEKRDLDFFQRKFDLLDDYTSFKQVLINHHSNMKEKSDAHHKIK